MSSPQKPKIMLISTGGTIAMRHDPLKGGQIPVMSGSELIAAIPLLDQFAEVEAREFTNIPSFHMTPEIMLRLARTIETTLARPDIQGVVVTHGTDILEETAYFLDLLFPAEKSICVTGSMRSVDHVSPDGPYNILSAFRVAVSPVASSHGVLVVMDGEIHAASRVTKADTTAVDAFTSPYWGPAGHIQDDRIILSPPLPRQPPLRPSVLPKIVPIIKCYTGMDVEILDIISDMALDGLVLEGYGNGNVPESVIPAINRILNRGIPVVIASRVHSGTTQAVYAAEGGGVHLKNLGVILSGTLSSQKARLKLMLALGTNMDCASIRLLFSEVGETTASGV